MIVSFMKEITGLDYMNEAIFSQKIKLTGFSIVILLLLLTFYFYENVLRILPSVVGQNFMQTYHLHANTFGFLFAVFYLIYAPMQLFVGVSLDRYGPRRLLTVAIVCCALGVTLFANVTTKSTDSPSL